MKVDLEEKISQLESYAEKPVGIFGARASGKTMFFTVLYGLSGYEDKEEKFSVVCDDEGTQKYLQTNYTYLLEGKLLPRTEINELNKINLSYIYNKTDHDIKSIDFAGELIEEYSSDDLSAKSKFEEKQKEVFEFFSNCGGLMIFLEPNDNKKECFKRQMEINKLISFIRDKNEEWVKELPIAIVFTKWDKVSEKISDDRIDVETKKAEEYLQNHEIYQNIYKLLSGLTENISVFPMSAFGRSRKGNLPPDDLNKPFNMFPPLVWISKKIDEIWVNRLEEVLAKNPDKKKAEKIVDLFNRSVKNETLKKEVKESYSAYKARRRNKKLLIALMIFLIVGTFAGFKLKKLSEFYSAKNENSNLLKIEKIENFIIKNTEKDRLSKKLEPERIATLLKIITSEKVLESKLRKIDAYAIKYSKDKDIKEKLIPLRKSSILNYIDNEKNSLKKLNYLNNYYEEYSTKESKKNRENLVFLDEISKRRREAKSEVKKLELENKVKFNYEELKLILKKDLKSFIKYKKTRDFIIKYPKSIYFKEIKEQNIKYLKVAERELYERVESYNKVDLNTKNKAFEIIEEYLAIKEFTEYRTKIIDIKEKLKDEYLYLTFNETLKKYNNNISLRNLREVVRKGNEYFSGNQLKRYKSKVNDISKQIKEIRAGKDVSLDFYVTGFNPKKDKKIEVVVFVGEDSYNIEKSDNQLEDGKTKYLDSLIKKIKLDTKILTGVYIEDLSGNSLEFPEISISFNDFNKKRKIRLKNSRKSINIEIKVDINNFKLK